jgi:hypothetical protein
MLDLYIRTWGISQRRRAATRIPTSDRADTLACEPASFRHVPDASGRAHWIDVSRASSQRQPIALAAIADAQQQSAMNAAPRLKVVSKHGTGTDTIDKAAASSRGIQVVAASGANAAAVAEHALALLLACAKSVVQLDERMRGGHCDKATHKRIELEGRTVGLIGLDAIVVRFARMADAMAMRVVGFDPYARNLPDLIARVDPTRSGASRMPFPCTARRPAKTASSSAPGPWRPPKGASSSSTRSAAA